jgi:hypothetical protein
VGARVVLFGAAGSTAGTFQYTVTGSGNSEQLLLDLPPGASFIVQVGLQTLGTFIASAQGTLEFPVILHGATAIRVAPMSPVTQGYSQ